MDRRKFIERATLAAGAVVAVGAAGCGRVQTGTVGAPPPEPSAGARPDPPPASGAVSLAQAKLGSNRYFEKAPGRHHMVVAKDRGPAELVAAAVAAYGGAETFINRGDMVVIKPNLAWSRGPEIGANTNPEVLRAVIKMAQEAGAGEVIVAEHSCDNSRIAFEMSGGREACEAAGVPLISLDNPAMYEERPIALGVNIQNDKIARQILECDVYINLPCLKHHAATNVTICMKNQMGLHLDRQHYHRHGDQAGGMNLHQNITDLATAVRPTINIVDAVRALTTHGPKGPGTVKDFHTVIVSHDIVAADALGAQMLGYSVDEAAHVRMAGDAGVGSYDLESLDVAYV